MGVQLKRLLEITEERRRNAVILDKILSKFDFVNARYVAPYVKHVYHLYLVDYVPEILGISKSQFVKVLRIEGIPITEGYMWLVYSNPVFSNPERHPTCIKRLVGKLEYPKGLCPNAEKLCYETGLWFHGSVLNVDPKELEDIEKALEKIESNKEELKKLK
ncbi:MAG: hypothetical protein B6U94_02155 [Thermofilum sp. ex4484_79]|nr:MAG: hypothetical protein B6U94_02155 [Thermofilum sp. ex4484_79]